MSFEESAYRVGSSNLRALQAGEGSPVLFLHGAAGVGPWGPFYEALAKRHRLIAPVHPGFGPGEAYPAWLSTVSDMARFYVDMLREAGLEKVHLVGSSLGGWIAAELAALERTRLASVTLIAPAGMIVDEHPIPDMFSWTPEQLVRNVYHSEAIANLVMSRPMSDDERAALMASRAATGKLIRAMNAGDHSLPDRLGSISAPVQIVWGDDDRITPSPYASLWEKAIPGARLDLIADCGHLPHIEKPGETAALVGRFIEQNG
jgi:pimeloyl-ACP methyl ester carboxylesterase